MAWCLARPLGGADEHRSRSVITRFDPRFWTVDFPRPMMASVVTTAPDALRVALAFTSRDALAELIWDAQDRWDHPLLAYATDRDFRRCVLRFRWRSAGVKPLDAVYGPVLTIEGRDAAGAPRAWYVRLWNYAVGTAADAVVTLDFDSLAGGFIHPSEADPVWAGDVDRMFLSLVPADYDGTAGDYAVAADAWVELSQIRCDGSGSVLAIGDAMLPDHGLGIATAYDDLYNQTPARVLRQVEALGYDGPLLHYVGMSHYARLARTAGGPWLASAAGAVINTPCAAWHEAFAEAAKAQERPIIWSLSYELFAEHCPPGWMQRDATGAPALTGWVPPSTLLSPANAEAMGYLALVARAFVAIAVDAGLPVQFQIGEPWWWINPGARICLYDAAAAGAFGSAAVDIPDLRQTLSGAQLALLDAAGTLLAQSTAALSAAVRDAAGSVGAVMHLLIYLPTILDAGMPDVRRANLPTGWAHPAFDLLQLEDYDWVARGQTGSSAAAMSAIEARLGYPAARQHYLAGFVLRPDQSGQWRAIDAAAVAAQRRRVAATVIWALPQVARDGFVHFGEGAADVSPFEDVDFPIAIGREASVLTEFSTAIVTGQSGAEQRSPDWNTPRLRYDAGPGVRSEADVRALIAFFRARRGPAVAFRFRDPIDASSTSGAGPIAATDQLLGTGDGVQTDFALVKSYGNGPDAPLRRITRPVAGTVMVSIDGTAVPGWTLASGGIVSFASPPASGAQVRAGFAFDVPVRFGEDRLEVSRATFLAGEITTVPLIEVRDA